MPLSNDLIRDFVKVTNDKTEVKTETTVYGTVVIQGDTKYVRLDGSDLLTPVTLTADAEEGHRVAVQIANHSAKVMGNASSPSATGDSVSGLKTIVAGKLSAENLSAEIAKIENLTVHQAVIDRLNAKYVSAEKLDATNAKIDNLDSKFISVDNLEATNAKVNNLETNYADIANLYAKKAEVEDLYAKKLDVDSLYAKKADIEEAYIDKAAIESLYAKKADIEEAYIDKAAIESLYAKKADIESLNANYANIDFANIGEAAINKLYNEFAFLKDVTSEDGVFTGELTAVTINADMIKSGTLAADRLIVKGEDGLYYKLNVDGSGAIPEEVTDEELQNGLHGSNIIAQSVTADKVSVSDLYAFDATIGGFVIDEDSIHSSVKTSVDNTTRGIYLDNDGQMNVGDAFNYIKYRKDTDGSYKLDISAESIKIGGTTAHVIRRLDGPVNQLDCLDNQGIRVVSEFVPTQAGEGDPSPDNIRAISGRSEANMTHCSKNLIDMASMYATTNTAVDYSDNTIRVYSTSDGTYRAARTKPMILRNGVRYTLSVTVTDIPGGFVRAGFRRRSNNSFITNTYADFSEVGSQTVTFKPTADLDVYFSIMVTSSTSAAGDATLANIQFEIADEATAYEKFEGDHYNVTFDEVVCGGSFDWTTGILSIDKEILTFDGTESWNYVNSGTYPYFYVHIGDYGTVSDSLADNISSHFQSLMIDSGTSNIGFRAYNSSASNKARVAVRPGIISGTDVASWTSYLAEQYAAGTPVQVCYRIVEPREIRVEPSQVESSDGLNTIYTDIPNGYMEFGIGSLSSLGGATQYDVDQKANADDVEIVIDRVNTAEQSIDSLNATISTLITGPNGETLMKQTDTGWTFSIKDIQESIDETKQKVDNLIEDKPELNRVIDELDTSVKALGESAEYVKVTKVNDQPCLALGETDSDFKLLITNTDIRFMDVTDEVANITNKSLNIDKAVIKSELHHGGFVWTSRPNGNWGILWKGE